MVIEPIWYIVVVVVGFITNLTALAPTISTTARGCKSGSWTGKQMEEKLTERHRRTKPQKPENEKKTITAGQQEKMTAV